MGFRKVLVTIQYSKGNFFTHSYLDQEVIRQQGLQSYMATRIRRLFDNKDQDVVSARLDF